jgi:hypothetical protein
MTAAERLVRFVCRLLPPGLRDWGEAMAQEAASIERPGAAMAFALGCAAWIVRQALDHALRSALTPAGIDPAELAARRTPWGFRQAAITCAIAATGLGLLFLAEAGAPARYLTLNMAALVAGLILVLPFRRRDLVTAPFVGVVAIAVGLILLLTAVLGDEASGARRWLSLGSVVLQPSLIGLPFLLVAFARSRDIMTTAGLVLAAIALALQPDRAMAAAMVAGVGIATLMQRDRMAQVTLSVALPCFIVTTLRHDAVSATAFVDGVFRTASSTGLVAGLAVWGGVAVLLAPPILGLRRSRQAAAAHAAFGATWLVLIAAALFGDYPVPVVAYGGSAIVGYLWSILALPADLSQSEPAPTGRGPASYDAAEDASSPRRSAARLSSSHSNRRAPGSYDARITRLPPPCGVASAVIAW